MEEKSCIYCGSKTYKGTNLCSNCYRKRALVREIKEIGESFKRKTPIIEKPCDKCFYGTLPPEEPKPCFFCPAKTKDGKEANGRDNK